ncbi:hypothetical protein [Lacicoccus alkaliphilus]|uniref:Uncharacterized protein n=1 Tax=Lacicoccus alkaliphilus DSM 16010 TaxID=1123231 RepID=A0A1M7CP67_9BACL|nr:hypothetical protein [Salinicoccus alkaliphilus]SHL69056.1 hypothetical protein SAMN02745189_00847 [Salinicoccus alkaliphilus DSM 16010]
MAGNKDKKDVFEEEKREQAREEERGANENTKDLESKDAKEGEAQTKEDLQDAYE